MREKKRLLPALLTIAMLLTVMPGTVYAAELPPNPEGTTINGIAYGDSMYSNYGTINGVSGTLTVNAGTVLMINTKGVVTYNHKTGSVGVNRGFLEVNQGIVDENNKLIDENNGTVTLNYANGTINKNEKKVTQNYGEIKNNNYNGVIERNELVATVQNNGGSIENNDGIISENGQSGRVTNNRANGRIYKNSSIVYNNSGAVYNNTGNVYNNSGQVTTNTGTVYNTSDLGRVSTNNGTVYNKFDVSKPSEVTNVDYVSGFLNYGSTKFFKQGSIGKMKISVAEGYVISDIHLSSGTVKKNTEGEYTITDITTAARLYISVEKKSSQQEDTPGYSGSAITPQKPASLPGVERTILSLQDDSDPAWTSFSLLRAKGVPKSKRAVKLSWKPVNGASAYIIYGNRCGKKNRYEKITSVSGTSWTQKKLKKGAYYKYLVAAVNGNKVLSISKTIHVATNGGKVGNNTKVTLNKKKKKLSVGKSFKLKATLQKGPLKVKIHRRIAFESDNPSVAEVGRKGKIRAKSKGTCYIYAYAQNGVFARCKVIVG